MGGKDLTRAQLKKAWERGDVDCIVAIETTVRFTYAKDAGDGYLLNSIGQVRYFDSNHLAWKFIDILKGNEPDPY